MARRKTDGPTLKITPDDGPLPHQPMSVPTEILDKQPTTTSLLPIEQIANVAELFTPKGLDCLLLAITQEVHSWQPVNVQTERGRSEIKSRVTKIVRTKTFLDDQGQDLVRAQKEALKLIDNERKRFRDTCDDLRDQVRAPLTEWESADQKRIAAHEAAIAEMSGLLEMGPAAPTITELERRLNRLTEILKRDWEECENKASRVSTNVLHWLNQRLDIARQAEKERAELERLRKEAEKYEREKREMEIRQRAAAEERARLEAQQAAREAEIRAQERASIRAEEGRNKVLPPHPPESRHAVLAAAERRCRQAELDAMTAMDQAADSAENAARALQAELAKNAEQPLKTLHRDLDREQEVYGDALDALTNVIVAAWDEESDLEQIATRVLNAIRDGVIPHVSLNY
jgi:hypothetical protein